MVVNSDAILLNVNKIRQLRAGLYKFTLSLIKKNITSVFHQKMMFKTLMRVKD
jgi:hypothetical protein